MNFDDEITIAEKHHTLINSQHLATLTTLRKDGMFSTNPVGYHFDGKTLRVSSLKSRVKYKNIETDSRIAFCIQCFKNPMNYLEIRGHASLHEDLNKTFFIMQFESATGHSPPEDLDPPEAERIIIQIHPAQISAPKLYAGRFDK